MGGVFLLISWGTGFVVPLVIGVLSAGVAIYLAYKRKLAGLFLFAVVPVAAGLLFSIVIPFTIWGALGPGGALAISVILTALLCILLVGGVGSLVLFRTRQEPRFKQSLFALYLVGGIVTPLSFLISIGGAIVVVHRCDAANQEAVSSVVSTLEVYRSDYGVYPGEINDLVPEYVAELPDAPYLFHYRWLDRLLGESGSADYRLRRCSEDQVLLTMPTIDGASAQAYDSTTQEWFAYDSWDDPCTTHWRNEYP